MEAQLSQLKHKKPGERQHITHYLIFYMLHMISTISAGKKSVSFEKSVSFSDDPPPAPPRPGHRDRDRDRDRERDRERDRDRDREGRGGAPTSNKSSYAKSASDR